MERVHSVKFTQGPASASMHVHRSSRVSCVFPEICRPFRNVGASSSRRPSSSRVRIIKARIVTPLLLTVQQLRPPLTGLEHRLKRDQMALFRCAITRSPITFLRIQCLNQSQYLLTSPPLPVHLESHRCDEGPSCHRTRDAKSNRKIALPRNRVVSIYSVSLNIRFR